jgi:cephalosporin-C deacetylase-like acetyl esterase
MLCCVLPALIADASAASVERIAFDSASQKLLSGRTLAGEHIQADLAKPDGAGPFPAVVVLHGCGGMHEATKQRLADHLVAWGYVAMLVDSYTTRGIQQACTSNQFPTFAKRRQDAYGALAFLAGERFVDPQRVAAVGFSSGGWLALFVTGPIRKDYSNSRTICASARRWLSIRHARWPRRVRRYPR